MNAKCTGKGKDGRPFLFVRELPDPQVAADGQIEFSTKTTTGLRVTVDCLDKVYATGRKYAHNFKETMTILFDDNLPKWNYRAIPESG